MANIITFPLKQKWGEEIEHKTLFNIDEDLVNYIKMLEEDIDKYNKELLNQGERIFKAIELLQDRTAYDDGDFESMRFQNDVIKVLQGSGKMSELGKQIFNELIKTIIQEKDKEIERLNNIINKAIRWVEIIDDDMYERSNELLDILQGSAKE